jgi:tetratricopeptide (TPR) repeat protein
VTPITRTLDRPSYPLIPSGGGLRADPGQKQEPGERITLCGRDGERWRPRGKNGSLLSILLVRLKKWRSRLGSAETQIFLVLYIETSRAHALLFVGRIDEARALYFAHKGRPMSLTDNQMWEDEIADDVATLRKAGLESATLAQITAKLGGKSSTSDADLAELMQKIQELDQAGSYKEAEASAEKLVAMARERYTENHPMFATAIYWQGFALESQARYAEAEPLLKRALAITEKAFGPDHPTVATRLNNLAALYQNQGHYAEVQSGKVVEVSADIRVVRLDQAAKGTR